MSIQKYTLCATNDLITSRGGLLALAELMELLRFPELVDKHFHQPGSNRGFNPSLYLQIFALMQHEGSFHLDDFQRLADDRALLAVLGIKNVPQPTTVGEWLRRMGEHPGILDACMKVNRHLLKTALHQRKLVTLDIDATGIVSSKTGAQWMYTKDKGYMPIMGHIAETGQIVAVDFRPGNVPPHKDNLAFILQCQGSLPEGCRVNALRIDAAGYQTRIIKYCDEQSIKYAIRAKMYKSLREQIMVFKDEDWQPFIDKEGQCVEGMETLRTSHIIGDYENPFTLIVQRTAVKGQTSLIGIEQLDPETIEYRGYVYRAIATNRDELSDSGIIHWYNQRAEDSENRIKELKSDFAGGTLPCSDFKANALYFSISAIAYNLLAVMRQVLPGKLACHRAPTLRLRLYARAAKVVRTGRRLYVKMMEPDCHLLKSVLSAIKSLDPPPI